MTASLDGVITGNWDELVDRIAKDAICQIPSYHAVPLKETVERVERWLKTMSEGIRQDDPEILAAYLKTVGRQRKAQGYTIGDLHTIISITERHLYDLIARLYPDQIERNAHLALLDTVLGQARMVLSVTFLPGASEGAEA